MSHVVKARHRELCPSPPIWPETSHHHQARPQSSENVSIPEVSRHKLYTYPYTCCLTPSDILPPLAPVQLHTGKTDSDDCARRQCSQPALEPR